MTTNLKSFLDMIANSEIGPELIAKSDNGYNVLVGSTPAKPLLFSSYADHPNILNKELNSTAAGRYQIIHHYWVIYKGKLNLPDFSPASQDAYAIEQIKESDALDDVEAGNITAAIGLCSHIWASLPGNNYGQHTNALDTLLGYYTAAGGTLNDTAATDT